MYIQRIIILVSFFLTAACAMAQDENTTTPIAALADSLEAQAKPVLILLSTDWCRYCKMQKIQLERNRDFQAAKNNFYFVEFNAETKDSILFNEKVYYFKNSGLSTGIHELAIELGNQKEGISYPLWIILDKDYKVLLRRSGLLAPGELKEIIEALSQSFPRSISVIFQIAVQDEMVLISSRSYRLRSLSQLHYH